MGWIKRKKSEKGVKTGVRTSLYLPRHWFEELKMVKEKKGLSHTAAVEWCLAHSWKDFSEQFGLDEKTAKSEKERKRIDDMEKALRAGKREYSRYCEQTSEERYMRHILFGRYESSVVGFADLMREDPFSLWSRIRGRGNIRPDGWVELGWVETGQ